MKKLIGTFVLVCLVFFVDAQKIIDNPDYGIGTTAVTITKIELTSTETALTFKINLEPGRTFGIANKSYIQIVGQPDSLFMIRKDAPEPVNGWITVPEGGLKYTLYFPSIDPKNEKIDFGEPTSQPWMIYAIVINKSPYSSIIPEELAGHWFSPNNGQWTFSFLEKIAVYENKTWEYVSAKPEGNVTEVKLKNGEETEILYCRADEKDFCFMRTNNRTLIRYSNKAKLQSKVFDEEAFEGRVLNQEKVKYSGVINGFTERLGKSTGMIRFFNPMNNQQESHLIKIDKNGTFTTKFILDFPQELSVSLPSGNERIFFEPGKSVFHLINSKIPETNSLFMGESALVNIGLKATQSIAPNQMNFVKGVNSMTPEEYVNYVLSAKKEQFQKLQETLKGNSGNNKVFQIRLLDIQFRAASNLINFNQNARMSNFYANRNLKKEEQKSFVPKDINVDLLKKISDVPVNKELAFISGEYFRLIQALKNFSIEYPQGSYYYLLTVLGSDILKQGKQISGEEKDMLDFVKMNLVEKYSDEARNNFNKSYGKVLKDFREKFTKEFEVLLNNYYKNNARKNSELIFGEPGKKLVEIALVKDFLSNQSRSEVGMEDEFSETKAAIKNEALKEYLISEYYQKKAKIEIQNLKEEPILKTEGDKLFHSIIKDFRGKVVFVDFWATWCGPCKTGIERIKPLKEELKNEDIVFVYITNNTSPEKDYKKAIPNIKGEHFKVSADEWNYLTQKFNIYGIPHYALLDKNGKVVNAHMMPLENKKLKKVLMEQVNK